MCKLGFRRGRNSGYPGEGVGCRLFSAIKKPKERHICLAFSRTFEECATDRRRLLVTPITGACEKEEVTHSNRPPLRPSPLSRYTFLNRTSRVQLHPLSLERNPRLPTRPLAQSLSALASGDLFRHVGGEDELPRYLQLPLGAALGVPQLSHLDGPRATRSAPKVLIEY